MPRVLVVDDDQAIRETLRYILEDSGFDVIEASDGLVALDILRTSASPLVVLLDLMMPRLGGSGVLGAVAEDWRLATCHAYALVTANPYTFPPAFNTLLSRLNVPVIRKPFDIDVLIGIVEAAAERLAAHSWESAKGETRFPEQSLNH